MAGQPDQELLREGIQIAQARLDEIKSGSVQTIPGEVALAQVRRLIEP